MKKSKFTDEEITSALQQYEAGATVSDVIRELGISEQTFYRWKKKFSGKETPEKHRLKQLEEENLRLKQMVADLSLDCQLLQEKVQKSV